MNTAMRAGAMLAIFLCAMTGARAAGFKDSELVMLSDESYFTEKRRSDSVYRDVLKLDDRKTGVQALALERKADNVIIISYAGTDASDIKDVLSDLGLGAKEVEHALTAVAFGMAESFEKQGWIPKGSAPTVRDALMGEYGGLKIGKAKAEYKGKMDLSCPRGAFFDPRKGGECWDCPPKNKRTVFPVDGGKACEIPLHEEFADADKKRKVKIGKKGCKKGEFWDKKGGDFGACWDCPSGFHRTAYPVDNKKACAKTITPKFSKAKFVGKAICPKGAFLDPIDGGTCWSCPNNYVRGVASVKSGQACISLSWQKDAGALFDAGFRINATTEKQLKEARRFFDDVLTKKNLKGRQIATADIIVVGHSLGGFIAQVIAAERDVWALTVNGPGATHYRKSLASKKIRNLARRNDAIGRLGRHIGTTELWNDVKFSFKQDIRKGKAYLLRNHSPYEFMKELWKKGK